MLRYLTAGESHGPGLVALIEGLPAGFAIDVEAINADLRRRQGGHGRGNRQKIERDQVKVLSGLRFGYTLGSPLTFLIENRDYWPTVMSATPIDEPVAKAVTRPRPGHADLAGVLKYDLPDGRGVLERASARETAARVAVGSAAKQVLASLGILVFGHVVQIGPVKAEGWQGDAATPPFAFRRQAEASPVRCADPQASAAMVAEIDQAYRERDSLGGVAEVVALGLPPGLGSHVQADRRLDGRLAAALMSIQAVKGVEVGLGFAAAGLRGSAHHDEIGYAQGYIRYSNRAGGLEGGMTNGQPLVVRAALKPISTLYKPLRTVQLDTHEPALATVERADTCAVPAFAVIAEAVVALTLATALLEKIGGDSLGECRRNLQGYWQQLARR